MKVALRRILAGVAAGTLSLLTSASMVAFPSLAEDGTVAPSTPYIWTKTAIAELQQELAAAGSEGLDPIAYDGPGLDYTLAIHGEGPESDAAATRVALALAHDYGQGRVSENDRIDWHIEAPVPNDDHLAAELTEALRGNRLRPWLRSLLPSDPRYAALRTALASTPVNKAEMRGRLRANLERWRWMPRTLGEDHIYVNVPSYSLKVVDDGRLVSTYTVVVGAPTTPTPLITAEARSIIVNPWWSVPPSIARHMRSGSKGFVIKAGGRLAQPPGPRNALGKVKIDMPNPHNIYMHDTPSKALFAQASRAYSHGCIRVKDIDRLAEELAELDQGNDTQVVKALGGSATRTLPLQHGRPVYLVYFTADLGADGRIVALDDPYQRDTRLIASLDSAPRLALIEPKAAKRA